MLSPDGATVAFVARHAGSARLVAVAVTGGAETVVAAEPEPAARGGVVAWLADGRVAYVTAGGSVAVVDTVTGHVRLVLDQVDGGASALVASPHGGRLAFVADTRDVTVVDVDGGAARVVSAGADFAVDPSWSPDGARLAWHEWDVPAMPWDAGRIVVGDAGPGGAAPRRIAGGPDVAVQEPRFSPDGSMLAWLCDATGWLTLWVAGAGGGEPRPVVDEDHEHGGPVWGPGSRSFAWSPDSREIAFCRNEAGFGRLCAADVATGAVRELSRGVHTSLSWAGDAIVCLRSGARTPTAVVAVDPATGAVRALATGADEALAAAAPSLPEPEVVSWEAADGAVVHGRLWRPPTFGPPPVEPPPLLVWAHGGPTDQRRVSFDPRLAFFLTRGWAVLHPDPRGSTGWGRAWTQALRRRWGEVDVQDVASGARAAVARGWGDPSRLVAMGGSAGGMTALLLVAAQPELWAAAVALYPVVDLEGLAAATHRYEAHYTVGLVGPLPETAELHRARSPLGVAGAIRSPLLLLHGADDVVVPASQSAALAERLRANGVDVEHHVYDGEGHGWRSPATIRDELERTEAFLSRHGLVPGGRMGR